MFFYLSKVFWFFAQPINLIGILLICSLCAHLFAWRRLAFMSGLAALLVLALSAWTSLGALMLHPLEDRFARPEPAPAEVAGIIVLGGGFEGSVNLARGGYELNASGDRMVETAVLARRYPEARVVVTGGTGSLLLEGEADADSAPRLLTALGGAAASGRSMAAGHVCIPHAALGGAVPQGGLRCRRMAGRLQDRRNRDARSRAGQCPRFAAEHGDRHPRMDRPLCLLGDGPHRHRLSRPLITDSLRVTTSPEHPGR
jgi:hypothetical protein